MLKSYRKANKELNNENYYKKLNHYGTQEHTKIINDTIEIFQREHFLPENIRDNLKTTKASCNYYWYNASKIFKFVDHYLEPHAKASASYVQDTKPSKIGQKTPS